LVNDTATTEIYTLSLYDALPISPSGGANELQLSRASPVNSPLKVCLCWTPVNQFTPPLEVLTRSEEHTSELQSHLNLVCRLLLEKKKLIATRACASFCV